MPRPTPGGERRISVTSLSDSTFISASPARSPNSPAGGASLDCLVDTFSGDDNRCRTRNVSSQELITRAFFLSKRTGDVKICKQRLELGDAGATAIAEDLRARQEESALPSPIVPTKTPCMPMTALSVCNHAIGHLGATALAAALRGNALLTELHLDHNRFGPKGAAALCRDLVTVTRLRTLRLANNAVGPDFPADVARCTSLTHLHLQHNDLHNVSIELGNHPSLVQLELTGNDRMQVPRAGLMIYEQRLKHSLEAGLDKSQVLKQLQKEGVDLSGFGPEAEQSTLVNWSMTELLKCLLDVKLNLIAEQRYRNIGELDVFVPRISEVKITLAQRWNGRDWEADYVHQLLSTHTALRSLNGLHEWPEPPMARSSTWDLTNSLKNPLYECNFVKNRLRSADAAYITRLFVDNNDLRGRAAKDLAVAVTCCQGLLSFSALQCQWDDTIAELGTAVLKRSQLHTVNGLTLQDTDTEWDLKGCLLNAVDAYFVVRILTEKGPLGHLQCMDLRGNTLQREHALAIAESLRVVQSLSKLNSLNLQPPPETVDAHLQDAKGSVAHEPFPVPQDDQTDAADMDDFGSPLSGLSAISSPIGEEPIVLTEGLDMRKKLLNGRVDPDMSAPTVGTMPIELTFFSMVVRNRRLLVDLNFSENKIGDANMPMVCHVMMELRDTLEKVHLNENGITEKGAQDLCGALECMKTLKVLRLNGNPLGTRGAELILQGLAAAKTIEALYMSQTKLGPFLPEVLYTLRRLEFLAIKNNTIIGIPVDFLKLERLATLWVDDNPIEFPPPPIPNLGFKRIFEWLRKSDASCAQRDPVTNSKGSDSSKFERIQSTSTTISRLSRTSSDPKRTSSDVEAARFERENAQGQGGAKSQRNELWIKIARRRFADSEEEGIAETKVREQCRLFRHGQQVHDMNFHPDLPIFASCSEDRTVKIWEQNPDLLDDDIWTCSHTLKGHLECVTHLAFTGHNDDLMLASLARDGIIRLWVPDKDPFGPDQIWTCGQVLGDKTKDAHIGQVRSLAFSPQKVIKVMLATGAEDNSIKIWGPTHTNSPEDANEQQLTHIIPLDDNRLNEIRNVYECFARGEIPGTVYTEAQKNLAGRGKRSLSMDMNEFMQFASWSGLLDCVSKTLLTSTFRVVSNHEKSDGDKRELTFEEFCELLFRISKKAQGPAGKTIQVKHVRWSKFGMIESIVDTDVNILNRYGDIKGLLEFQGDMGWACLYTIKEVHLGTVMALTWLPVKDPVLVSAGVDNRIKLWAFTENSRGRGQWTKTNDMRAHEEALIRDVNFVTDVTADLRRLKLQRGANRPRAGLIYNAKKKTDASLEEEDRVMGVSSAADSSVMIWKINTILQTRTTLEGSEVARQYLLKKGQKIEVPDGVNIFCAAFRNDGNVLAVGCMDGALLFWTEVEQDFWMLTERFKCHEGIVNTIRFGGSPCLTTCVTISGDGKCCVLDTSELLPAPASDLDPMSVSLPPRREARMFQVREIPPWSVRVDPDRMERLEKRLGASSKSRMREVAPTSGQHVVLRCQEAVSTFAMEMSFDAASVWYKVQAGIRAISVDTLDADLIPDMEIVSPIVDFMPQNLSFRKPITVKLPHHSVSTENLVLLQCVDASPKTQGSPRNKNKGRQPAVWEPVPCTVSSTHVTAHVDRIRGSMVVVESRKNGEILLKAYAIPLCLDGRPVNPAVSRALDLQISEAWQGMIEVVPATSVQALTALSSGFQDCWQLQPLYSLAKGASISSLVPHPASSDVRFEIRSAPLAGMTWEGLHMVISIELTAWHIPDMLTLSRQETHEGSRPAAQEGRSSPASQQRSAFRAPASLSRCSSASSSSSGKLRSPRASLGTDTTAYFALALEDASGHEVLRLELIRVTAVVPIIRVLAKWGIDPLESCSLEIPLPPGSPLSELRLHALSELASPRSPWPSTRRPSSRLGTASSGRVSPPGIANVMRPSSRGSLEVIKKLSTGSGGAGASSSILLWEDMQRPHTSQNKRILHRIQERPHTSEGMRAVPESQLFNLHFTSGGSQCNGGAHRGAQRKSLPTVSRSGGLHFRPRSVGFDRSTPGPSSLNLVPHKCEQLMPAAAIGTRGFGMLVLPKTAPVGAARELADIRAEGRRIIIA